MKFIFSLATALLFTGSFATAYELNFKRSDSENITVKSTDWLTTQTKNLEVCSSNERLDIEKIRLWMIMPNGHQHGSTPLSWTRKSENCYSISKVNFVMSGSWQIQLWQPGLKRFDMAVFIGENTFELNSENGSLDLVTPRISTRHKTKWLICGEIPENVSIDLLHQGTRKAVSQSSLKPYGTDCVAFSKLPLPVKGKWAVVVRDEADARWLGLIDVQN